MTKKCIVLFSGGLDSRLVVEIMKEKGFEILCVYFKLPFGGAPENEVKEFIKKGLKVFDCTKGKLLQEYLKVVKTAKHGTGAGMNPCIDCKIFMFKKAKEFADKKRIKFIVTGEVVGQRPMSQRKKQIELIEKESGLEERIIRPLIDLGIYGRQRKKQMALAKKFKIKYPSPAGGCLLCEKFLKKRFEFLFKRGLKEEELVLVNIGRHFIINTASLRSRHKNLQAGSCWVVIGRNQQENEILENLPLLVCPKLQNAGAELIVPDFIGPTAILLDKQNKKIINKVKDLIKAYSKKGSEKEKKKFEEFKI